MKKRVYKRWFEVETLAYFSRFDWSISGKTINLYSWNVTMTFPSGRKESSIAVIFLSLSFSLDKRASCNLRNRFPSSYYIVSPERGVIHRGGKVGQEMWSVCGGLYRPTPNLLLICCVDNGANGMILSKPVCVYIYMYHLSKITRTISIIRK